MSRCARLPNATKYLCYFKLYLLLTQQYNFNLEKYDFKQSYIIKNSAPFSFGSLAD